MTVTTDGIPLTGIGMFAVTPALRLVSVTPNVVTQGQTATLTITGEFTHFQQGLTQANLGQGITIGSLTVNSATSITAVVTAASDAAPGSRILTVTDWCRAINARRCSDSCNSRFGPHTNRSE